MTIISGNEGKWTFKGKSRAEIDGISVEDVASYDGHGREEWMSWTGADKSMISEGEESGAPAEITTEIFM